MFEYRSFLSTKIFFCFWILKKNTLKTLKNALMDFAKLNIMTAVAINV